MVEGACLENRCTGDRIGGSNPFPTALCKAKANATQRVAFCIFESRQKLAFVRLEKITKHKPGGPFAICFTLGDQGMSERSDEIPQAGRDSVETGYGVFSISESNSVF